MLRIAVALMMLGTAAEAQPSPNDPIGTFSITTPTCCTSLTFGDSKLIITADGVVTNGAGVPLDEMTPEDQIATMCEAFSYLAKNYTGVTVKRCGKP